MHGIERWRSNCGCNSGGHPEWNQEWRAPLRTALDWLRDALASVFESKAATLLKDPWRARDEYIRVILDRSDESLAAFFGEHATHELNDDEKVAALKLLEMQRHAQLMYTSCGWFFDELSGIETVQVIQYARRAVRLGEQMNGGNLEAQFVEQLRTPRATQRSTRTARAFTKSGYSPLSRTSRKWPRTTPSARFLNRTRTARAFIATMCSAKRFKVRPKARCGWPRAVHGYLRESRAKQTRFDFGVLHMGDHNITCGIREASQEKDPCASSEQLFAAFARADAPAVIRLLDEGFGGKVYSLRSLFRDEQRKILSLILRDTSSMLPPRTAESISRMRN